jgi:cytochrome c peroxidase
VPASGEPPLTSGEIAALVAHGPWPPPFTPDASNRLEGVPSAIELGRRLFFDKRLSRFAILSCASCHKPELAYTDGRRRASASVGLDRNTPSLLDVAYYRSFGWDGGGDSLWAQSLRPILDRREMAGRSEEIKAALAADAAIAALYRRASGRRLAREGPERMLVTIAKALGAFQATLVTPRTRFDALRDRLGAGLPDAVGDYPKDALQGARLFVGRARCNACHAGARFTNDGFHRVGESVAGDGADAGRADGLRRLAASPYRRDGSHSDAPQARGARRTATLAPTRDDRGAFRVPTLRGLLLTAPYFHDGSRPTLADAVRHGEAEAALSAQDVSDIVAFLATLSVPPARPAGVGPPAGLPATRPAP